MGLYTLFAVHIYTGITLVMENRKARGSDRYVVSKTAGGSTVGSKTMIYTGLIIALFTIVHLLDFHFVPHDKPISDIVAPILAKPLHAAFYAFAMLALGFH